jgi:hypothetical protein
MINTEEYQNKIKQELLQRFEMYLNRELCKVSYGKLTFEITFQDGKCTNVGTDTKNSVQMK